MIFLVLNNLLYSHNLINSRHQLGLDSKKIWYNNFNNYQYFYFLQLTLVFCIITLNLKNTHHAGNNLVIKHVSNQLIRCIYAIVYLL